MRGFPGFVHRQAAPPSSPATSAGRQAPPGAAALPTPAPRQASTLVVVPQTAARPATATAVPPAPVPPGAAGLRQATVATVSRNLLAALAPASAASAAPPQAFPGFVSRQFDQVQQYRPATSSAGHLNNLANLVGNKVPATPPSAADRRGDTRTDRPARPNLPQPGPSARSARLNRALKPALTAARLAENRPIAQAPLKKAATPENSRPSLHPSQAKPQPVAAKPQPMPAKPQPAPVTTQPANLKPGPAKSFSPTSPVRATQPASQAPTTSVSPKAAVNASLVPLKAAAPGEKAPLEKTSKENPQVGTRGNLAPAREANDGKRLAPNSAKPVLATIALSAGKAENAKAETPLVSASEAHNQKGLSDLKAIPLAKIEIPLLKISLTEVQRQQVNPLSADSQREPLPLAEQAGQGLSSQSGQGRGGGQQQQQQQQQQQRKEESEEESEDVFEAAACSGQLLRGSREEVQWWHLKGASRIVPSNLKLEMDWLSGNQADETALAFSSELRESTQSLRAKPCPPPALAVTPERLVKPAASSSHGQFSDTPPRHQQQEEAVAQGTDEELVVADAQPVDSALVSSGLCSTCGVEIGPLDPRRCPCCVQANALETLRLLEADGNHLAYRVFMTHCPLPVASQAVYRLRDFAAVPRSAYWVQARQLAA